MKKRDFLALSAWSSLPAFAHHGWSSFDLDRPIFLEGKASKVRWHNPHAELMLELGGGLQIPSDLSSRPLPAQTAQVDGAALLKKAILPIRKDKLWEIELAPLTRMEQWQVPEIKNGQSLAVLGFTFKDEKGAAIVRVEYLWLNNKTYALRSAPA